MNNAKRLSTARVLQLTSREDNLSSKARTARRAAARAIGIKNFNAADYFEARAIRMEKLAERCRLLLAIDQWLDLASNESSEIRADIYRRTAKALLIEFQTGVAVCSCCFKPFGRGSLSLEVA